MGTDLTRILTSTAYNLTFMIIEVILAIKFNHLDFPGVSGH